MAATTRVGATDGDWVFITPVGNVVLTEDVNEEFRVDLRGQSVLFVSRAKLPRIRRRLGINVPVSSLRKSAGVKAFADFFDTSETFAVVRQKGKPDEIEKPCFRLVRDAISILALSQLGYSFRRFSSHISLYGEHEPTRASHIFLNKNNTNKSMAGRITRGPTSLVLDARWQRFQQQAFFANLMRILSGATSVDSSWRKDLLRVALLVGQSNNSNDIPAAFLWNMVGLEVLLTKRGDSHSTVLPKRIEAFLGWVGFWNTDQYEQRIKDAYATRCALVHDGDKESIQRRDLLFSDDLLLNMLYNIVSFPKVFRSKEHVIHFADLVEAERMLGLKSRVRPKNLLFISRKYSEKDLDSI